MTLGFKTQGNIKYGIKDSQAIVEEIYQRLKEDAQFMSIVPTTYSKECCIDTNMQKIEKQMDFYIKANEYLQQIIVGVFAKRNVIIPLERATEKNEVIQSKKMIIIETLGIKDYKI